MKIMLTIKLVVDKETKNTIRFAEVGEEPKVGVIYIPKSTLSEFGIDESKGITVTIKEA